MIAVDRSGGPLPPTSWLDKALQATQHAIGEGAAHQVDDGVYGHVELRAALESVFSHKCAYCESETTATSSWDVEHFRPKGRVAERADHPGYYWLAYTWTNLYLSCQFCNQRRADKPTTEDPTAGSPKGKLDQFPLRDEATRALQPDADVAAEARLMLDPCSDDPEQHLAVDAKGRLVALAGSDMATKTIEVCHLNRRRLRLARTKKVKTVVELISALDDGTQPLAKVIDAVTATLGKPAQPYALVARSVASQPAAFGLNP